jgi:carboxyl-terminal processing protease
MPIRNLTYLLIAIAASLLCYAEAGRNRFASRLSAAIDIISQHYVDDVNPRTLFEGGMQGMIQNLDPYSGFISSDEYNQFQVEIKQEFGGIGIEVDISNDQLTVFTPLPGTPAYDAGVMAGDVIVAVDGESTERIPIQDAVRRIQGKVGTSVTLTLQRPSEEQPRTVTLKRAKIAVESIRGDRRSPGGDWIYTLEDDPRIAYIRLIRFGEHTADELRRALESLEGRIDGMIIDLRGNAGGLLDAAIEICEMFINQGETIVSIRRRHGVLQEEYLAQSGPIVDTSLPMAILVDGFSASASEIVAACLQDHGRAEIVGQRTWGKGTVQNVIDIEPHRSAMRLTTATYWRPSGKNIHRHRDNDEHDEWGVRPGPEFEVKLTPQEYQKVSQSRRRRDVVQPADSTAELPKVVDPQFDRALDFIRSALQKTGSTAAAEKN